MRPVKSTLPSPHTLYNERKLGDIESSDLMAVFRLTSLYRLGLLYVIVCVLASSSLLAHLNVRYSLSTTPLKIVFISGMPDPIAWKAANFESQNLSNLFCLISNCSWLLLGITWGATTCTNPVENRTRNTGRETCEYFLIECANCKHGIGIDWKCVEKLWAPRQRIGGRYLTPGLSRAKDEHYCTWRWCSPSRRRRVPWWHQGAQGRPSLRLFGQMCVSIRMSLFWPLSGKHHHDRPCKIKQNLQKYHHLFLLK